MSKVSLGHPFQAEIEVELRGISHLTSIQKAKCGLGTFGCALRELVMSTQIVSVILDGCIHDVLADSQRGSCRR